MNLKDQKRYKVFLDESYSAEKEPGKDAEKWRYRELRGRHGFMYSYSGSEIAVCFTSMKIAAPVKREKRWRCIQDGDFESVFLLPDAEWKEAARLIKAKKRPSFTPEQIERYRNRMIEVRRLLPPVLTV
jgi:hypothetical protein